MRLRIAHETTYSYERAVKSLIQLLRLTPRDHDGQHVRAWRIEPLPPISFPGCPERWWGDEALKAETDAPQATLEQ